MPRDVIQQGGTRIFSSSCLTPRIDRMAGTGLAAAKGWVAIRHLSVTFVIKLADREGTEAGGAFYG
jgi:hypothetical protein